MATRVLARFEPVAGPEFSNAGETGGTRIQNVTKGASASAASTMQLTAYLVLAVFLRNIDKVIPRNTAPTIPCQMK